jgi:hypothetical protein
MHGRAGRRSLTSARQERRQAIRTNRSVILAVCASVVVASVGLVVLMGLWKGREMGYFAAGLGTMSVGFVAWLAVESREARRLFDAGDAERFTAGVLRRLRGRGWRSVDHVEFDRLDIDHVVAGPGGVFAVETKWTNYDWQIKNGSFDNSYAIGAVNQCRDGAWKVSWLLRGNYKHRCDVRPLLVVWGPGRPMIDAAVTIDDVLVVPGHLLRRTLSKLHGALDIDTAESVVREIEDFTRIRDEHRVKRQQPVARPAT